ncbi:glycosyltransferase [Ginsengibacter hankyongi]|nr:glycosyltransferase [Ginsengibacter hankyongi]
MRVIFSVTNDLNYDQRMIRICNSLVNSGFNVKIIGVEFGNSSDLQLKKYTQKRIRLFFKKGFGFYLEYNVKLFFYLLFQKTDAFCCIDLDTMLPVYFAAFILKKIKVYDAHEYFSQQKEIITRPGIYKIWHFVERTFVPKFLNGYTVSEGIAKEFHKNYKVNYEVIRNVPVLKPLETINQKEKIILYQGSVNEGRGFEFLIPAMKSVNAKLFVYGDGNFSDAARSLVTKHHLGDKILFAGKFLPDELNTMTPNAYIGINLVEQIGLNQFLSLANKFFNYIHYAVPQLTMNFPEYKKINEEFEVALLINSLSPIAIENSLNLLLNDDQLYRRLQQNCIKAREVYHWQREEKKLISFYENINSTIKR